MPAIQGASLASMLELLEKHEVENGVKFVKMNGGLNKLLNTDKSSYADRLITELKKSRVLCVDGLAVIKYGTARLFCQHGPDQNAASRKLRKETRAKEQQSPDFKSRSCVIDSRKLGCPATVTIERQFIINGFKVENYIGGSDHAKRANMIRAARNRLRYGSECKLITRFFLTLPDASEHKDHPVGEHRGYLPMDDRVRERVKYIVNNMYITKTRLVAKHLHDYVTNTLFKDGEAPKSTRFYPSMKDLKNCINAVASTNHAKVEDYDKLKEDLHGLNQTHHWEVRKCKGDKEQMLIVHQTKEQKVLMQAFGNEICMLDSTHKVSKCGPPLYLVVVQTNVDYQVVASFMISEETTELMSTALSVIQSWNVSWKPQNWMVDCSLAQISAVEDTFSGASAWICDFHRLQEWNRWLAKKCNNFSKKTRKLIRSQLNALCMSTTEDKYISNLMQLWNSKEWMEHENFKDYFNHTWLDNDMHKRWVSCYKRTHLLGKVKTNAGIEGINNKVKSEVFHGTTSQPITVTFTKLLQWLDTHHSEHLNKNLTYPQETQQATSFLRSDSYPSLSPCPSPPYGTIDVEVCSSEVVIDALSAIRSICDEIQNWTYKCTDDTVSYKVLDKLAEVQRECQLHSLVGDDISPPASPHQVTKRGSVKRKKQMPSRYAH